jgi:hypothetical protein
MTEEQENSNNMRHEADIEPERYDDADEPNKISSGNQMQVQNMALGFSLVVASSTEPLDKLAVYLEWLYDKFILKEQNEKKKKSYLG